MKFRSLALAETVGVLLGSGSALVLSLFGYGVWALCAQSLALGAGLEASRAYSLLGHSVASDLMAIVLAR
jgi:hypothetical protein